METTTEQIVQQALERQKAGQPEEALALIEPLLAADPTARLPLFARGCVKIATEDIVGAITDWETALEGELALASQIESQFKSFVDSAFYQFAFETTLDAGDPIPLSALGRACRLFGRYDEAVRYLGRTIDLGKSSWKDAQLAAELYGKLGQADLALQMLNKILESKGETAELHYQIGVLHQQQNSTALALRHLEKAAQLDKNDMRVRLALGELYLRQVRFDQAEPMFALCLQHAPSARAHLGMAEVVKGQYRFDEALDHYRKAVELDPKNLQAISDLGALALQFGDLELGVDMLKKALEIDPTQADVYGHLAKAAQQKGDVEQAIQSYRQLLTLAPNDSAACQLLGNLLRGRGEYHEAAYHLKTAADILTSDVQVALDLADCLVHLGRQPEAIHVLKQRFENNPNHNELRAVLEGLDPSAVSPQHIGAPNIPVREEFNPFLDPAPVVVEPTFDELIARAHKQLAEGQEDKALASYRSALHLEPKNRECLIETGRLYAKRGLLAPAADLLQQGYSVTPDDMTVLPELMELLGRLDEDERDETVANLILSVPVEFDRGSLLNAIWRLQALELPHVGEVLKVVAQGLLTRFSGDQELRRDWDTMKNAPPPTLAELAALEEKSAEPGPTTAAPPELDEEAPSSGEEAAAVAAPEVSEPPAAAEGTAVEPPDVEAPRAEDSGELPLDLVFDPDGPDAALLASDLYEQLISDSGEPAISGFSSTEGLQNLPTAAAGSAANAGASLDDAADPASSPAVETDPASAESPFVAAWPSAAAPGEPQPFSAESIFAAEPVAFFQPPAAEAPAEPAWQAPPAAEDVASSAPASTLDALLAGDEPVSEPDPSASAAPTHEEPQPEPSSTAASSPLNALLAGDEPQAQPDPSATAAPTDAEPQPDPSSTAASSPLDALLAGDEPVSEPDASASAAPPDSESQPNPSSTAASSALDSLLAGDEPQLPAQPDSSSALHNSSATVGHALDALLSADEPLAQPDPATPAAEEVDALLAEAASIERAPGEQTRWSTGPACLIPATTVPTWFAVPGPSGQGSPAARYRSLAASLYKSGWLREAVLAFGQALQLEPEVGADWLSHLLSEWVAWLRDQGNEAEAYTVCSSWAELFPDDEEPRETLALLPAPEPEPEPAAPTSPASETAVAINAAATPAAAEPQPPAPAVAAEPEIAPTAAPVAPAVTSPADTAAAAPQPPAPAVGPEPEVAPTPAPVAPAASPSAATSPASDTAAALNAAAAPATPAAASQPPSAATEPEIAPTTAPVAPAATSPAAETAAAINAATSPAAPAVAPTPTSPRPAAPVTPAAASNGPTPNGAPATADDLDSVLASLRSQPANDELLARILDWAPSHEDALLTFFRNVTKETPVQPLHFRNFARLYMKTNKPMLAVVQYLKFVGGQPSADGYRELAQAYTVLNREKNAADALKKADDLAAAGK